MLLTGVYPRTLDDKLRLAFPKRLRDAVGSAPLYMAPGAEGCIGIYPEMVFESLADRLGQSAPVAGDAGTFSRLFFAQAHVLELDKQGRARLPQEIVSLGRIEKEVVILGVRDHMELWNRSDWNAYLASQRTRYDEIAERAFRGDNRGSAGESTRQPGSEETERGPSLPR